MEEINKTQIKSKVYKQALQNFERNYSLFLKEPTLENYIDVKNAQKSYLECKNSCISKNQKEILDSVLKKHYSCFSFAEVPKFEEVIKLRAIREAAATRLVNYLLNYEHQAKKMGKKLKANYADLLINFFDKLNEVELSTKVGKKFPAATYVNIPAPSKVKLSDIRKLKNFDPELNM